MPCRSAAGCAVILLAAGPIHAGSPEWAKPFLANPVPEGGYISEKDKWVSLRTEIQVAVSDDGHLVRTFRQVLAPTGDEARELTVALEYDSEEQDLVEPSLWVPGAFGYKPVKMQKASVDIPDLDLEMLQSGRSRFITTKEIEPGERAILTWQVVDKRAFPGEDIIWPFGVYPCARLSFRVEAAAGSASPQVFYVEPGSSVAPRAIEGEHVLESLPASRHLIRGGDPWLPTPLTALPFFLVRASPVGEKGWPALSTRVAGLFEESLASDTERGWITMAKQLTAGAATAEEKTALLAGFVQSLTYRNVQWGIGAYKPESPSESLRSGSADCKGKALLLQAFLADAGVESVPVLCRIGPNYQEEPAMPTVRAFNHVVLAIRQPGTGARPATMSEGPGAGWLLFDPTDPVSTLGQPPQNLEGSHALWLDARAGDLFEVHTSEPGRRLVHADLDVDLSSEESASFRLTVGGQSSIAAGLSAGKLHQEDKERFRSRLQQILAAAAPGVIVEEAVFHPPDHLAGAPPRVVLRGRIPSSLQPLGGDMFTLASPSALISLALDIPALAARQAPEAEAEKVVIPPEWKPERCCQASAASLGAKIHVTLPEGWSVQAGPRIPPLDAPWLKAQVGADPDWTIEIEVRRGRFPPDSADRRKEDLARLSSLFRQPFIIATGDSAASARRSDLPSAPGGT